MPKFRKKPVEIEAVQITAADYNPSYPWDQAWDGSPFSDAPDWIVNAIYNKVLVPHNRGHTDYAEWDIRTLEGTMSAGPGDWIIRGVEGELYACKSDIFKKTYEEIDA